jgi:hypothetical protein
LVTRLADFTRTRSPLGLIGYPVARFHPHSVTFRRDWLPGCAISPGLGYLSACLVTLLGISPGLGHFRAWLITLFRDFTCTRSPFGMIGYPVARFHVHSVTFRHDWLPGCAFSPRLGYLSACLVTLLGISPGLGHFRAWLITLFRDFTCTRSPFGMIGYPVARFHVHSVTFRHDWLPGWRISHGLGHLSAGLVTRLADFTWTRSPFGGIGYPVAGFRVDSVTFGPDWLPGWRISRALGHL